MQQTITLIGSGNVAWQLGQALQKAGHRVEAVYSRTLKNAEALANLLPGCIATDKPDFTQSKSSFFLIAVNDQALQSVADQLNLPANSIVAHTSGSMPMTVLERFPKHGVFYPLQTFTKTKQVDLSEVYFGIEASGKEVYEQLFQLAFTLSRKAQSMSSAQRKVIHIAAVFACNFTNHLFLISKQILEKEQLDFELLKPLVKETVEKAFVLGPDQAQTGPAIRGDEKIIQQHLQYLTDKPDLQNLYRLLSENIRKQL